MIKFQLKSLEFFFRNLELNDKLVTVEKKKKNQLQIGEFIIQVDLLSIYVEVAYASYTHTYNLCYVDIFMNTFMCTSIRYSFQNI